MPDKYLYADSEPFPHRFDFLATFRGFLSAAASIYRAVDELANVAERAAAERARTEALLAAIDVFASGVEDHIEVALARNDAGDEVRPLADGLKANLRGMVAQAKENRRADVLAVERRLKEMADAERQAMRHALDTFFLEQELSTTDRRLSLELSDDKYHAKVDCQLPSGIHVQFALSVVETEDWSRRRRVGEFVEGIALHAGLKKRFLGEQREVIHLDDLYVSSMTLSQTQMELGLRKRADSPEVMNLLLQRNEAGDVDGTMERPEEPSVEIDPEASGQLIRLWQELQRSTIQLLQRRSRVVALRIDGDSIYEPEAATRFIARYAELFAPVVQEISSRSPSMKELSLKIEHEDGKREEIYLRKEELAAIVADVSDAHLPVLHPFALNVTLSRPPP